MTDLHELTERARQEPRRSTTPNEVELSIKAALESQDIIGRLIKLEVTLEQAKEHWATRELVLKQIQSVRDGADKQTKWIVGVAVTVALAVLGLAVTLVVMMLQG